MANLPEMSYRNGTDYLKLCFEQSNLNTRAQIAIDLSICDVEGRVKKHRIQNKLALASASDLMGVIMTIQLEVDIVGDAIYHNGAKPPGALKEKLLIRGFNIVIGDAMAGMPPIAGDLIGESHDGKMCKYVKWSCDGGMMHQYWENYKNWLLKIGDTSPPALFKIWTVKRDGAGQLGLSSGGHYFLRPPGFTLPIHENPVRKTVASGATPRNLQAGPSSAQQTPATHESSTTKPAEKIRIRYNRAEMEEILKSAPPARLLEHQPSIEPSEVIFGRLIVEYILQFADQPSVEEMESMQEEIRANGFGTRPVVTLMEDESKKVPIPDTPTKVPEQFDQNKSEETQDRYYKQPDKWSNYQDPHVFPPVKAFCDLDNAQYQPSVIAQVIPQGHPAYIDPVEKAKSKGKEREYLVSGGEIRMFKFRDFLMEQATVKGDEHAARVLKANGIYFETEERAKGFDEADDEIFLLPEVTEEDNDGDDTKDGPPSDSKALAHGNVAAEIQTAQTEQYSQYAGPSYGNTGYGSSASGYNTYSIGGNQYQATPYGGNPILPHYQSSTPARAGGGFPQIGFEYSTSGQTNFNPAATSWNAGGVNTFAGNATSRFDFGGSGTSGTTSTFNPNVPTFNPNVSTFQSRVNPIIPTFRPKAIGNLPNPLQVPHGQANSPFVSGDARMTSPFGLPGQQNPFTMKYPHRFEGPGTPVNPNYRPPPVGQKPKQPTPLKESTTMGDEDVDPGVVGDMQYGTSMRLNTGQIGPNPKSTLSAILNADPSPTRAAQAAGSGQGPLRGHGQAAASRGRGGRRHNRGGSAGSSGRGDAQTGRQ